jgi:hypothetical protein
MFESESDFVRNIKMIGNDSTHFCAQTFEMESLKRCFFLKGLTIQKFLGKTTFLGNENLYFFFREN